MISPLLSSLFAVLGDRSHKTANRDIFVDTSQIANQKSIYRFANPLSNRQSKKSQIHNPQSKIE
ncbi:hypothetical protein C7B69_16305 [filamentous cyanobacterium Phorm 46]|nr:hypothetical protein C7B69_16305 [filamentous cyanobacterium Phorm 46]